MSQDDDSDETEGRKLYRQRADALANAQLAYGKRKVRYNPEFVKVVLAADAAPIEATFDNFDDMMNWLEE